MLLSTQEILLYGALAFIFVILIWIIRLEIKLKRFMRGTGSVSFEDSIITIQKDLKNLEKFRKEVEEYLRLVEKRVQKSIQGVHSINFNAFKGMDSGGQSFATAFVNENGDGVIISSLNARDRLSIFTKKISNFKTDISLSEEEQNALTKAIECCKL